MPIYDVHIYPIYRLTVRGVQAPNMQIAMAKAQAVADFYEPPKRGWNFEFADDIDGFYVDVVGDREYNLSRVFDKFGKPEKPRVRKK